MFSEEINKVSASAIKKSELLKKSKMRYLTSSVLAGIYVGFGILLIFTIGGLLSQATSPATKIVMGASFGIALSLVIMAGSELFTGNNMTMTIGSLEKKVSWLDSTNIWIYSFIGNFVGSAALAAMFVGSGLAKGSTAEFILKTSQIKMASPSIELFLKGLLCNMLVCLAVWCSIKLKEETAKLIMIFWCLFAFITTGFEHSIANMTLLTTALMIPHSAAISIVGLAHNLIWVTLGNFVGGAVFIGAAYWFISKEK
ncbi:formate/nitrite transporter family protein [Clostridium estertheticum]|uniref:Nitrite transporter NirC n=1 Tax=Clostridium estertheticum subsp. estertheticum TaxID=1552 RepID=A0A1J0GL27_9CLOT|nr:formate/nitrite transporter family protein [Clostridium estertheticum]APC41598.1 nitrite transporter NirC [Clostridium estertheticum subsp. estertheticum]MBU3072735.1 formate/nitrite transporter family protein [Clostridium estertheticum]MBU3163228.1 formate/nitrite transporter family protein [Clostridium estertheticum]MBU3172567.1 formate/nitrite transporter family protein [Clostridium estertheticum]MBZ9616538.1 formate/nitrite transporter family protein [Clostridium estertheticum subsp. la